MKKNPEKFRSAFSSSKNMLKYRIWSYCNIILKLNCPGISVRSMSGWSCACTSTWLLIVFLSLNKNKISVVNYSWKCCERGTYEASSKYFRKRFVKCTSPNMSYKSSLQRSRWRASKLWTPTTVVVPCIQYERPSRSYYVTKLHSTFADIQQVPTCIHDTGNMYPLLFSWACLQSFVQMIHRTYVWDAENQNDTMYKTLIPYSMQ